MKRRSFVQSLAASPAALSAILWSAQARAAIGPTLTIAYNVAPPGFDPNSGSYAVNPGLQSIFKTLYDPYFEQDEDLSLRPGLLDQFSWSQDRNRISMRLRRDAKWHDGKPVTPDDVLWNLRRLGTSLSATTSSASMSSPGAPTCSSA
jgi:peptide/nickel transport system substrate-binding protein